MTLSNTNRNAESKEPKLPRRDWIILPALSLLTICSISVTAELIARRAFSESKQSAASCMVLNDPSTGPRQIPNSVCWEKVREDKPIEYRFNSCGHRAGMECGPKPDGVFRIVMTGSSFAFGARVPIENVYATLLPIELSRRTGHKIELYNESQTWGTPHIVDLHFNQVLKAKPDLILWAVTPFDIRHASSDWSSLAPRAPGEFAPSGRTKQALMQAFAGKSIAVAVPEAIAVLRKAFDAYLVAPTMLRHFLYESQSLYLKSYLLTSGDDTGNGFLKDDLNEDWKSGLQQFEVEYIKIHEQAVAADMPLVTVLVPNRPQAAMLSMTEWPAGCNPYKLDDELRTIVTSHGGTYIDILPGFRTIPNPERDYLPVDDHPTAQGHAILSELLANELTGGAIPALRVPSEAHSASERGK